MIKIENPWWVLFGLFLLYMATNGILLNTLPLLYPELTREFGWNEEQVTRPASVFLLISALLTPVMGALSDRFPARRIMCIGVILIVIPIACLAYITQLSQMMVIYLIAAAGLASCGMVQSMLILSRWFVEKRGLAVGLFLMASSLGGALFPLLVRHALAEDSWREAVTLVIGVGGAMMMLGLLLVRNHPPQASMASGGATSQGDSGELSPPVAGTGGYSLGEAARLPAFWVLMLATGAVWFCIVGILQHQSIYLGQDLGVSSSDLPLVFSVFFWSAITGKVLFGYLGDRFNKVIILLLSIINLLLGLVALRAVDPAASITLFVYAVVFGVGFAGAFSAIQLVLADFFAGPAYGRILGTFVMVDSLAGAAGIQFLGLRRVADGSYLPALNMLVGMLVVVSASVLLLRRYRPEPRSEAGSLSAAG